MLLETFKRYVVGKCYCWKEISAQHPEQQNTEFVKDPSVDHLRRPFHPSSLCFSSYFSFPKHCVSFFPSLSNMVFPPPSALCCFFLLSAFKKNPTLSIVLSSDKKFASFSFCLEISFIQAVRSLLQLVNTHFLRSFFLCISSPWYFLRSFFIFRFSAQLSPQILMLAHLVCSSCWYRLYNSINSSGIGTALPEPHINPSSIPLMCVT